MSEPVTVLSDAHQVLIKRLERMGLELMVEQPFPPYCVDVYIPGHHVGIEIDGPHHQRKRDETRDEYLLRDYFLPIFHVRASQVSQKKKWRDELQGFLGHWFVSAEFRRKLAEERLP